MREKNESIEAVSGWSQQSKRSERMDLPKNKLMSTKYSTSVGIVDFASFLQEERDTGSRQVGLREGNREADS